MIFALIVVYNKSCEDSITIKTLQSIKSDIETIVFDNSTKNFDNKEFCEKHNYCYYGFLKNYGLSYAYNYVIRNTNFKSTDYLMILDDDTELTKEYINEAIELTKRNDCDIFLPIVKTGGYILSPSNFKYNVGSKIIKSKDEIILTNCTAINSGMLIKSIVFNEVEYDNKLFLDYVDHDFMKQVHDKNYTIKIMNSVIYQNYSKNEKSSIENALFRFGIYKKDFYYYCKKHNSTWFYYLSIAKLLINNIYRYRTVRFLFLSKNDRR